MLRLRQLPDDWQLAAIAHWSSTSLSGVGDAGISCDADQMPVCCYRGPLDQSIPRATHGGVGPALAHSRLVQ